MTIAKNSLAQQLKSLVADFNFLKKEANEGLVEHRLLIPSDFDEEDELKLTETEEVTSNEPPRYPTPKNRKNNDFLKLFKDISGKKESFGFYKVIDFKSEDWIEYKRKAHSLLRNRNSQKESIHRRMTFGFRLFEMLKEMSGEELDKLYDIYSQGSPSNMSKKQEALASWFEAKGLFTEAEHRQYLQNHRLL